MPSRTAARIFSSIPVLIKKLDVLRYTLPSGFECCDFVGGLSSLTQAIRTQKCRKRGDQQRRFPAASPLGIWQVWSGPVSEVWVQPWSEGTREVSTDIDHRRCTLAPRGTAITEPQVQSPHGQCMNCCRLSLSLVRSRHPAHVPKNTLSRSKGCCC